LAGVGLIEEEILKILHQFTVAGAVLGFHQLPIWQTPSKFTFECEGLFAPKFQWRLYFIFLGTSRLFLYFFLSSQC